MHRKCFTLFRIVSETVIAVNILILIFKKTVRNWPIRTDVSHREQLTKSDYYRHVTVRDE